jgi:hypothetical protein
MSSKIILILYLCGILMVSSTGQGETSKSELLLKPVNVF